MNLQIRVFKKSDAQEVYQLFYNTVHHINLIDYDHKQLDVWAKKEYDQSKWAESFENKIAYIAESDDVIVGFVDATKEGYVDRLYTHYKYQNQGVATLLLNEIEHTLLKMDVTSFEVYASITAVPFFKKHLYLNVKENIVERDGITLVNYLMKKEI